MEMDFGLGAYDAEECAEIFALLRPLRVAAGDFEASEARVGAGRGRTSPRPGTAPDSGRLRSSP